MPSTPRHKRQTIRESNKARKRLLYGYGHKPAPKRWATCVTATAIAIPVMTAARALKDLPQTPWGAWFRGRANIVARKLIQADREAGGDPIVVVVEYRVCRHCGRTLLGAEAAYRRDLDESAPDGRMKPCGAGCGGG